MMLSIIIPTLDEEEILGRTLSSLGDEKIEVIIADGGSRDSTQRIAEEFGAKVIASKRGRASQLNAGAKCAGGDILLFLHADTVIPEGGVQACLATFADDPDLVGGGFERYFDSPSKFLRWTCQMANWRARRWGYFLGDQGIVVRKSVFEELGGFSETLALGEDLDFSIRLRNLGKTHAFSPPVVSSARRFIKKGPVLQTLHDLWLTVKILFLRK